METLLRHCQTKEADKPICESYDHRATSRLYSQTLTPTAVPLPAALPLPLGGIAGLGFMRRRKAA